jgi:hypothetical protein
MERATWQVGLLLERAALPCDLEGRQMVAAARSPDLLTWVESPAHDHPGQSLAGSFTAMLVQPGGNRGEADGALRAGRLVREVQ